ncbi:MAG: hypothetical protein OCC49_03370 [Fibrobacterales bacterium]
MKLFRYFLIFIIALVLPATAQLLESDSLATKLPDEQKLSPVVTLKSAFLIDEVTLGDTALFTVVLSYSEARHPLLFQPSEGSQFNNLELASVNIDQKKVYSVQGYLNITTYHFKLITQGPGIAGNNLYTIGYEHMGKKFELEVPAHTIEILPMRDTTVTYLMFGFAIILIIICGLVFKKKRSARVAETDESAIQFFDEIALLKKRIKKADSKQVLTQIEYLAIEWLKQQLGSSEEELSIHELYQRYSEEIVESESEWKHILNECNHLKFGGGKREEFELMKSIHILSVCLEIKEEE